MRNRLLACAVLIGTSTALAAPPTDAPAPQDIDVDALARAKDVDAKAAETPSVPEPAEAADAEAAATTPPAVDAADTADTVDAADAADAVGDGTPEAKPDEAGNDAAAADPAPAAGADGEAPAATTADSEEQRLAAGCVARANSLLDAAQEGDYVAATRDFDARMAAALPAAKFGEVWSQLGQFGKLQARGQSHPLKGEGYLAVTIPLIFEKKNLYAQVACGSDGRIAGFYVKPLELPAP